MRPVLGSGFLPKQNFFVLPSRLPHQVGAAYVALKADPMRAVTVAQVRDRLAKEHTKLR
jgi:hypothetical protein